MIIRLVILVALLYGVIQVVRRVTETLNIVVEPTSFGIGLIVAAIVGSVYFWLTNWWSTVTRPARAQSVKHSTDETPSQITWASFWAIVRGAFVFTIVGIIIYLFMVSR
jgi:hypothetical protein